MYSSRDLSNHKISMVDGQQPILLIYKSKSLSRSRKFDCCLVLARIFFCLVLVVQFSSWCSVYVIRATFVDNHRAKESDIFHMCENNNLLGDKCCCASHAAQTLGTRKKNAEIYLRLNHEFRFELNPVWVLLHTLCWSRQNVTLKYSHRADNLNIGRCFL